MNGNQYSSIVSFIWNIADDILRDLYVRGKYRDVILPMTVLRRLDSVLEPTKKAVLDMKASLDKAKITNQDAALRKAAGQAFYNTSKFTLRDLRARTRTRHQSSKKSTSPARSHPTRCMVSSRRRSTAKNALWNMSLTATCATPSKFLCWRREASRPSFAARSYRMPKTHGLTNPPPRSAMKFLSHDTSTNRSPCVPSKKSVQIF